MIGSGIHQEILNDSKDVKFGGIYENYAAQELSAHGFPLYYYNSKKRGELDFLIEYKLGVVPLEIKSGKGYKRHSALSNIFGVEEYGLREAYVVHNGNVEIDGKIVYIPTYMIMCFRNDGDRIPHIVGPDLRRSPRPHVSNGDPATPDG